MTSFEMMITIDGIEYHVELDVDFDFDPGSPATFYQPPEPFDLEVKSVGVTKIDAVCIEDGEEIYVLSIASNEKIEDECCDILNKESKQQNSFLNHISEIYVGRW